jgi:hypothetical protein
MAHTRGPLAVRTGVVTACLLLVAACGGAQEVGGADPSDDVAVAATPSADVDDRSAPTDAAVEVEDDDRPVERSLRPTIDAAIRDLATRAGVDPDEVTVVLAQRVTWSDETLGCPLRGDDRLGGPRQGIRVHLEADERVYRYHTGGTRDEPFLCDPRAAKSEELDDRIEP